jgi:hypothetical protein
VQEVVQRQIRLSQQPGAGRAWGSASVFCVLPLFLQPVCTAALAPLVHAQVDWDYHMRLSPRGTPWLDPADGSIVHFFHFRFACGAARCSSPALPQSMLSEQLLPLPPQALAAHGRGTRAA